MKMQDFFQEFRRVCVPKYAKFAEFLDLLTLPIRAVGYEARRFFSTSAAPLPCSAVLGRALGILIVFFVAIELETRLDLWPFFGVAVLAAAIFAVLVQNYLRGLINDIDPPSNDEPR